MFCLFVVCFYVKCSLWIEIDFDLFYFECFCIEKLLLLFNLVYILYILSSAFSWSCLCISIEICLRFLWLVIFLLSSCLYHSHGSLAMVFSGWGNCFLDWDHGILWKVRVFQLLAGDLCLSMVGVDVLSWLKSWWIGPMEAWQWLCCYHRPFHEAVLQQHWALTLIFVT